MLMSETRGQEKEEQMPAPHACARLQKTTTHAGRQHRTVLQA